MKQAIKSDKELTYGLCFFSADDI